MDFKNCKEHKKAEKSYNLAHVYMELASDEHYLSDDNLSDVDLLDYGWHFCYECELYFYDEEY